jgi:hypothetical protein
VHSSGTGARRKNSDGKVVRALEVSKGVRVGYVGWRDGERRGRVAVGVGVSVRVGRGVRLGGSVVWAAFPRIPQRFGRRSATPSAPAKGCDQRAPAPGANVIPPINFGGSDLAASTRQQYQDWHAVNRLTVLIQKRLHIRSVAWFTHPNLSTEGLSAVLFAPLRFGEGLG